MGRSAPKRQDFKLIAGFWMVSLPPIVRVPPPTTFGRIERRMPRLQRVDWAELGVLVEFCGQTRRPWHQAEQALSSFTALSTTEAPEEEAKVLVD